MARGDGDLLFDPPRIKKAQRPRFKLSLAGKHSFAYPVKDLAFDSLGGFSLQEKEGCSVSLQNIGGSSGRKIKRQKEISLRPLEPYSLTSHGLLVSRDETLFLYPGGDEDPFIYPLEMMADVQSIKGLFLGSEVMHVLWSAAGDMEMKHALSTINKNTHGNALAGVDRFVFSGEVALEQRGDKGLVIHQPKEEGHPVALLTLSSAGTGTYHPLHEDPATAQALLFDLKSRSNLYPTVDHRIVPGDEDGTYFAYVARTGQLQFLDLRQGRQTTIAELSKGDLDDIFTQKAALSSDKGRGLIFFDQRLLLFDQWGVQDEMKISGDYNQVLLIDNQALLWREGSKTDALKITID